MTRSRAVPRRIRFVIPPTHHGSRLAARTIAERREDAYRMGHSAIPPIRIERHERGRVDSRTARPGRHDSLRVSLPFAVAVSVGLLACSLGGRHCRGLCGPGGLREVAWSCGRALSDWPRGTVIPLDHRHPTLLIFLHPLCPCSSASVDELEELVRRTGDRVGLHAVVLRTASLQTEGSGDVERSLADVPAIKIWQDMDGAEARRFGVLTSGHVLLYEPGGRLIFSGGITRSRGHRGDNFGRSALLAAIHGERIDRGSIPVFGCPLFDFQGARTVEAPR